MQYISYRDCRVSAPYFFNVIVIVSHLTKLFKHGFILHQIHVCSRFVSVYILFTCVSRVYTRRTYATEMRKRISHA